MIIGKFSDEDFHLFSTRVLILPPHSRVVSLRVYKLRRVTLRISHTHTSTLSPELTPKAVITAKDTGHESSSYMSGGRRVTDTKAPKAQTSSGSTKAHMCMAPICSKLLDQSHLMPLTWRPQSACGSSVYGLNDVNVLKCFFNPP